MASQLVYSRLYENLTLRCASAFNSAITLLLGQSGVAVADGLSAPLAVS